MRDALKKINDKASNCCVYIICIALLLGMAVSPNCATGDTILHAADYILSGMMMGPHCVAVIACTLMCMYSPLGVTVAQLLNLSMHAKDYGCASPLHAAVRGEGDVAACQMLIAEGRRNNVRR